MANHLAYTHLYMFIVAVTMELIFNVEKQVMTRTDNLVIASHSRKVHSCSFTFSEEWADMEKSATFKKNHITYDVLLDNDSCIIPSEVLRSAGVFEVGVYGSDGQRTITSNLVSVEVVAGSPTEGVESRITPSLFEQIIKKINEVKKGEVEPELILEAVTEYLAEHPLDDIVVDEVASYVTEHVAELKGEKGDTGAIGKSAYQIAVDNGYSGTEAEWIASLKGEKGDTGAKGDTGETPTITMAASVDATSGTPNVEVRKTGTPTQPKFDFNFSGLKGSNGTNGTNGKSAYQIAVDNGFVGTEEQWLASLKGDKGDKGDAGATYDDTEIKQDIADIWKVQGELGAKNLIPYPYPRGFSSGTTSGVTFTINDDGSVTLNGTATANIYKLLHTRNFGDKSFSSKYDNPNVPYLATLLNGTNNVFCNYNPTDHFTTLAINNGTTIDNLTVYPMVRYKSDTDDTWQPYVPTNRELAKRVDDIANNVTNDMNDIANNILKTQSILGAKNLLPYPYDKKSRAENGITWTINDDTSITANGTATAYSFINLEEGSFIPTTNEYIATIKNANWASVTMLIGLYDVNQKKYAWSIGVVDPTKITFTDEEIALINDGTYIAIVRLFVNPNRTADNVTVYPMMRLATDPDNTWRPYAPTNYQLNQKVDTIAGVYLPNASTPTSKKVVASVGQTSVTFDASSFMTQYNVTASDLDLDISAETSSGDAVAYNNVSITGGIVTVTFDALAERTTFICKCSVIQ